MKRRHILAALYTPDHSFIRQLLPASTDCALRFNAASTAHLTIRDSHPAVAQVMEQGVRAAVWMVTVDGNLIEKRKLLEGPVGQVSGTGPFGAVTIPVIDDFDALKSVLAWPTPGAAISGQDDAGHYTGPSETRALSIIAANVTRLGLPWDVAASEGRGSVGTTDARFDPAASVVDALTADRLRLRVIRDPATNRWDVDVVEGETYSRPLTPQSGVLTSWSWALQPATLTRVVVGGAGFGDEREFALVVDTAREAALGRILEGFVEAGNAATGAALAQYGLDALAAAGPKASVSASLRESSWFSFPSKYDIGTGITVQAGAMTADDIVSEIRISHSMQSGFEITPQVGFAESDPQARLVGFVSGLASSVRSLERR